VPTLAVEIWDIPFIVEYEFIPGKTWSYKEPSEPDQINIHEVYLCDEKGNISQWDIIALLARPVFDLFHKQILEHEEKQSEFDDWEDYKDDD